jgi:hypothetical protein
VTDCIEANLFPTARRPPGVSRIRTCVRSRLGSRPRSCSKSAFLFCFVAGSWTQDWLCWDWELNPNLFTKIWVRHTGRWTQDQLPRGLVITCTKKELRTKSEIEMWVPTIDSDIDVGACFPQPIDVSCFDRRSLINYTADRNDRAVADVTVVTDVTIGYTCYWLIVIVAKQSTGCDWMHWVQTDQLLIYRHWLCWVDSDQCNWVWSIGSGRLMLNSRSPNRARAHTHRHARALWEPLRLELPCRMHML